MYTPIRGKFILNTIFGAINNKYWKNGHLGIDLLGDTKIYATGNGTVKVVNYDKNGWGNYISIEPEGKENYREIFCHLKDGSIKVKNGDKVTYKTQIATMGSTGNSTGVHLHYQVNLDDTPIDAAAYLGIPNKEGTYKSADYEPKFTGWKKGLLGMYYYKDNVKQTGWQLINGNKYYFTKKNGILVTKCITAGGYTWHIGADGVYIGKTKA